MGKFKIRFIAMCASLMMSNALFAYPLPIERYVGDGNLYIESTSITRVNSFVRLVYVINFSQAQSYGSNSYLSKANAVKVDCENRRIFALSESFYTQPDLGGDFLGQEPLYDIDGQYAEPGSWVAKMVSVGCSYS